MRAVAWSLEHGSDAVVQVASRPMQERCSVPWEVGCVPTLRQLKIVHLKAHETRSTTEDQRQSACYPKPCGLWRDDCVLSNRMSGGRGGETSKCPAWASHGGGPAASRDKASHSSGHMAQMPNHATPAGVCMRQAVRGNDSSQDKSTSHCRTACVVLLE